MSSHDEIAEPGVRFLAEAGEVLASSLNWEATLVRVAHLAIPALADWCIVDVLEEDGETIKQIAVAAADPEKEDVLREMRLLYPPTLDSPQPAARALRVVEPVLFPEFDPDSLAETVRDERHLELITRLDPRAAIALPLVARDRTIGALTLAWAESGRRYGEADVAVAVDLARRAALAVDNAVLFEREREARAEAERALGRLRGLEAISEAALEQLDLDRLLENLLDGIREVMRSDTAVALLLDYATALRRLSDLAVPHVADWCIIDMLGADGRLERLAVAHDDPEKASKASWFEERFPGQRAPLRRGRAARGCGAGDRARRRRRLHGRLGGDRSPVEPRRRGDHAPLGARRRRTACGRGASRVAPSRRAHPDCQRPEAASRAETLPLELPSRELWLSIGGVGFAGGIVYAFRDLTEERVLEELRSEFVSTISHELRTPLAAIYGAAVTLRREDLRLDESQHDNLLNVIASEADRLARTVNDILWASRLDADRLQLSIVSCDARELARTVVDAARAHLPAGIELTLSSEPALPPVAGDPDKVRQVLANLVDNAIKYSPDGGPVEVAIARRDHAVRFSVRDLGLGIPSGDQRRIFDKFYRLDPNLTRGVGGTGLGLYICRELVRRMDGTIWVDSREGEGSRFTFELPAAEQQAGTARSGLAGRSGSPERSS